jgi:hypothetical protein
MDSARLGSIADNDLRLCESSFFRNTVHLMVFLKLHDNPLPLTLDYEWNARPRVSELFSVTTHIGTIRERATTICIGLQDLELPAPLTLEIIDADVGPNNIRMWAKWELITAVKHFHQRQVGSFN